MLDDERDTSTTDSSTTDSSTAGTGTTGTGTTGTATTGTSMTGPRRRRAASRPAGPPTSGPAETGQPDITTAQAGATDDAAAIVAPGAAPAPRPRKRATKKASAAAPKPATSAEEATPAATPAEDPPAEPSAPRTRKRATTRKAPTVPVVSEQQSEQAPTEPVATASTAATSSVPPAPGVLFQPPEPVVAAPPRRRRTATAVTGLATADGGAPVGTEQAARAVASTASTASTDKTEGTDNAGFADSTESTDLDADDAASRRRRRGGRGRRGRGRSEELTGTDESRGEDGAIVTDEPGSHDEQTPAAGEDGESGEEGGSGTRRRRRRRRRSGSEGEGEETTVEDPPQTVVRVRTPRTAKGRDTDDDSGVRSVKGSTRLEAKKQRRREGREAGRRRPSVITEAEFLARRESVDRTMVVRQQGERTQIAVLEDDILVEHYVSTATSSGLVGNVYLGRVQNVLPSMEAAFVDIGKGRNAVLYAGEVNWDAAGLDGQPRRIELALKSGDPVLVQVTKDPMGHKGARLTSQVSLAGRYLVYVPAGSMTGISRKLPDTERTRLKSILKTIVPEGAGVIVRTAAEGASEEALTRDVARLTAQWEVIEKKRQKGAAPSLLYSEPDMTIRVVRDIFNEDFARLVISGDEAWEVLEPYVGHVAPDLRERMSRWTGEQDVFAAYRVDEQLAKALDRKVWLPSGGYLVIDRTEAMIVVDVNTGKFTGQGGNLEETVTTNNLEAAEEIVRQLRLRDLGGIIVIDFIDMVLETNRDLVLRRLLECLGRDRTKHQVAEVTSLGLVQMTRKRVGQGLHEVFAQTCEACSGRGYHIHTEPVSRAESTGGQDSSDRRKRSTKKVTATSPKPAPPLVPYQSVDGPDAADAELEPLRVPTLVEDEVEVVELSAPSDGGRRPRSRGRRAAASPVTTL